MPPPDTYSRISLMEVNCPEWVQVQEEGLFLLLHCQPGAKLTRLVGEHGGRLKIALNAPAVDNKANEVLLAWLAQRLGLPRRQLQILSGQTSRLKKVMVQGLDVKTVISVLNQ